MKLLWQQIPSTLISEIYAKSDFDGVIIDIEHSPFNSEKLFNCIQVVKLCNKKCFVRLAYLDKVLSKMCLDAGVDGLIFSTVEDTKQSKEIIEYCRYPHFGGKRGQGLNRENLWGKNRLGDSNPKIIAQIETKKGVDNLRDILKHDFDMYLIGPYDLSASLSCVEEFENNYYLSYINKIKDSIPVDKLGIHLPKNVSKYLENYLEFGFIAFGMDTTFLIEKINEMESL